jgi:sensor histidine kinase regulating citrate/malate metabolism
VLENFIQNSIFLPKILILTQIFNFGFTTKIEERGFGLHAGALAALEMGGNLIAMSEGLGKGSTFTLKIPRNREKIS